MLSDERIYMEYIRDGTDPLEEGDDVRRFIKERGEPIKRILTVQEHDTRAETIEAVERFKENKMKHESCIECLEHFDSEERPYFCWQNFLTMWCPAWQSFIGGGK